MFLAIEPSKLLQQDSKIEETSSVAASSSATKIDEKSSVATSSSAAPKKDLEQKKEVKPTHFKDLD